jgi:hypothetical protein
MAQRIFVFLLSAAFTAAVPLAMNGQDKEKQTPSIKGGIEGKVKKVDAEKGSLTITTTNGKERTFTVEDDTTIVGPRGGIAKRRLKDPRFHEGMDVTIVADGATAKEVHLGFSKHTDGATKTATDKAGTKTATDKAGTKTTTDKKGSATDKVKAAAHEEDDEDMEIPGKIKSVDPSRHMLVVTLLNGKDHSYMIAKDVKILVKGTASAKGLEDPALKAGIPVHVVTDPEGRKVKEVKVAPAVKGKKAG